MFTEQAFAVETAVNHEDAQGVCDILDVPNSVDELGNKPAFPDDEWITSSHTTTDQIACTHPQNSGNNNVLVTITNTAIPPRSFSDLWYVVDAGSSIAFWDGGVGPVFNRAIKIDSVGVNRPLVNEIGGVVAGVFESGETWEFILDGYSGPDASKFGSVGVPSQTSGANPENESPILSTGSIIATPIEKMIGGELIAIDTTSVLLAGAQMTSAWLVPIIVSVIGIGIILARKF